MQPLPNFGTIPLAALPVPDLAQYPNARSPFAADFPSYVLSSNVNGSLTELNYFANGKWNQYFMPWHSGNYSFCAIWNGDICGAQSSNVYLAGNTIALPGFVGQNFTGIGPIKIGATPGFMICFDGNNYTGKVNYVLRTGVASTGVIWGGLQSIVDFFDNTPPGANTSPTFSGVCTDGIYNYFLCHAFHNDGTNPQYGVLLVQKCDTIGNVISTQIINVPVALYNWIQTNFLAQNGVCISPSGFNICVPGKVIVTLAVDGSGYAVNTVLPADADAAAVCKFFDPYDLNAYVDPGGAIIAGYNASGGTPILYGPSPPAAMRTPYFAYALNCRECLPVANGVR
jgi:hypothetical protein